MHDRHRIPPPLVLLILLVTACAGNPSARSSPGIEPERIAAHVNILASDAYEGRAPGSAGETLTVDYLANAYRSAGLVPLAGTDYRLSVPLVRSVAVDGHLAAGGTRIENGESSYVRAAAADGEVGAEATAIFAGFGVRAPGAGRDDFSGMDISDRIVVVFAGLAEADKDGAAAIQEQWSRSAKLRNAAALGARAVVVLYDTTDDDPAWNAVRQLVARDTLLIDNGVQKTPAITAVMNRAAAGRFASAFGTDLAALKAEATAKGFRARKLGTLAIAATNRTTKLSSSNVAGMIRGRERPEEYVIYLAHWDHLGHCAETGDTICNGAVDNASGVGGLIELARAFGTGERPRRSVVFLATTAEESGLLGARYFVSKGPIPATSMVAAFGLDTIAVGGPGRDVIVLGQGQSTLDKWLAKAAADDGRRLRPMPEVQSFFTRSDHFAFAEAGVPAVVATGVFTAGEAFETYMQNQYHKPSDAPSTAIDYRGAAADVALVLRTGQRLANSREWPRWKPESPYQRRFESQP